MRRRQARQPKPRQSRALLQALRSQMCTSTKLQWVAEAFYVPVPARLTFCGLPPPLSLTETDALRFPVAEGVKVTVMKQLAPARMNISRIETNRNQSI